MKVSVIGAVLMGKGIVKNLPEAGHDVFVAPHRNRSSA